MKRLYKKSVAIVLAVVMALPVVLATPFSAAASVKWTAVASSDFSSVENITNGADFTPSTYNEQGNAITWNANEWNENPSVTDGAVCLPDGYMYMSGYSGESVPITGASQWKLDFGFRFKSAESGDDEYFNSDEYTFLKMYVFTDKFANPAHKNAEYCYLAQNANGVCYSWQDDGHNAGTQSQETSITANNGKLEAGVDYHYVAEFTGDYFSAYITDDSGKPVQVIAQSNDSTFIARLNNISSEAITAFKIGDDDNYYFYKGLEYRNITFYTGEEQSVSYDWTAIASSDFTTLEGAVTNGNLGKVDTYNDQGSKMAWATGVYTQNGDSSLSDDGSLYIPDGYLYMSGHNSGSVPISGLSSWKLDFGFRFKTSDSNSVSYYLGSNYTFLKMYVYTDRFAAPAHANADYCYFSQNANGVCYSWQDDGHNAGSRSRSTSITANNGKLSVGVNYHYVAEFTGSTFKAYITDDGGNIVQNIAETSESTFISRLNNCSSDTITSLKIGDDDNKNFYKGLEYRNITFYTKDKNSIHFDMSRREKLYKGSTGFLYGEAEINVPSIDLLQGLQPDTMVQKAYAGKQHPTGDAVRTGSALLSAGAKDMQIYLQDHYLEWPYDAPYKDGEIDLDGYQKTVEEILYAMICDDAEQGDEGAFLGSDGKYHVLNSTAENYSYVLFNEPDQIWYGGNLEGLERAWKKIYDAVHAIDPDARCAGPNFSVFNADSYNSFLEYCYNNNCLPEIISWHELGDGSIIQFYDNYDSVKSMQKTYYTDAYAAKTGRNYQPELLVNEYARHYDIGAPGGLVKWLAMFEDKNMSGCMAYWAMANTLNEMAADQNSPSSTWWVYHWYAQMTGKQCPLVSPGFAKTRFYGLTTYDEDINTAYVLFGGGNNGTMGETVNLDKLNFTSLKNNNGAVNVKVYAVSFSGQLGANYKPEVVYDGTMNTEDNSLEITVQNTDEMQAYFAVVTKPDDGVTAGENEPLSYPVQSYEAEDAKLLGGATAYPKTGWTSFATSGRADVGNVNNNGDGVKFTVDVPEDGKYKASLFYSMQAPYVDPQSLEPDANGQNRGIGKALPYGVWLDSERLDDISLESTVVWAYKNHCDIEIYLTAGTHTLTFEHINGDEGNKGNLQLVAALDKLDLRKIKGDENDFEISLSEMKSFKENGGYRVTAIAPAEGYYTVSASGSFELKKQCVDYAADAKSFSTCSVYDTPVGKTVFLAKGANTLFVEGTVSALTFTYQGDTTAEQSTVINSSDITLVGDNPKLKSSAYADSGNVITDLGIGQSPAEGDKATDNYAVFCVNVPSSGVYNFSIRYSNDEPAPIMQKEDGSTYIHPYNIDLVERYAQISVGGAEPETVYFKNTLSWDTFRTVNVQFELRQGKNTVKIYNDNSYQFSNLVNSTAPEIDKITVSRLTSNGEKAERAEYSVDDSALKAAIAAAQRYVSDEYGFENTSALEALIEKYKNYSADNNTQEQIDAATCEILTAITDLKPYLNLTVKAENGTADVDVISQSSSDGKYSVLFGNPVTLTARADSGCKFLGWYETTSNRIFSRDSTYTFKLTANTDITAKFVTSDSASVYFMNDSGYIAGIVTKTAAEWQAVSDIADMLPKVPYKYGGANGRWDYDSSEVLSDLRGGTDVTVLAAYDETQTDMPEIPVPTGTAPELTLTYSLDTQNSVGTFVMAAGIPQNCRVESVGIAVYYQKPSTFNPTEFCLTNSNKLTASKFEASSESNYYVLDITKLTSRYNWAVRGYVTYYDASDNLKIAYTNQINLINREQV
ncbi:MAG: hypothetical protein IJ872_01855 [Eubacterium sp.]|nr:hypothetical protein [Eubacterium sp.]